jgi:glyoxylase-like metal-dependent hydrolase (beta-lactamase superfamily II)
MIGKFSFIFLALSFSVASTMLAQQPPQQPPDFSKVQVKVQNLAESVFVLQSTGVQTGMGNIGAFFGDDGILLVDSQLVELGPKIDAALKTISDKPVKYVLNTHWHGDHTGGNAYWGKTTIRVAQDNVSQTMQKEPDRRITNLPVSLPTFTFSNQLALYINGSELRAIYFGRAHTDGDVVVLFPKAAVVHMGDIFTNFDPPHFPAIDNDNDGTGGPEGAIAAIEYVLTHAPDNAKIIPGHGAVASKAELRTYLDVLKATTAVVQAGISQGKTLDQLKQEKVLAQWDYLDSPPIRPDVYLERLYKSLLSKNSTTAGQ